VTRLLVLAALLAAVPFVRPAPAEEEAPWFTNVADAVGLKDLPAKTVAFADLDGDGAFDVLLDRRTAFLSLEGGAAFVPQETGIPAPGIRRVPLDDQGRPDEAEATEGPFVPDHVYFADVDGDGDVDALAGVHAWWERQEGEAWTRVAEADPGVRSAVWLNDGSGRFAKAPASDYGSDATTGPAMALAVVDVDRDGLLDLFEGQEYRRYGTLHGCGVDRLYRGTGGGRFRDVTKEAGLWTVDAPARDDSSRPTYGVTAADVDGDGWADLLALSYGRQWNRQWRNRGDGTFVDVARASGFAGDDVTHGRYPEAVGRVPEAPFRSNGNTFDCAVGDVDGDLDLDLFLGEIQHAWAGDSSDPPSLLVNLGAEAGFAFRRVPVRDFLPPRPTREPERWNLGDLHAAFFDADNDARLDLLIGSGDYPDGQFLRLYRQEEDGTFTEATERAGFSWEGCGGLSLGDYDRDGDVDVLAGRSFMRLTQEHRDRWMGGIRVPAVGLFRNDVGNRSGNRWLNVRLVGRGAGHANRAGIGARVLVTAGGRTQVRELRAGSGLSNHQDPPEAAFGLGRAERVDRLEVRWPNREGTVQVFEGLPVDRFLVVTEGDPEVRASLR
jgi:hypothetical protein